MGNQHSSLPTVEEARQYHATNNAAWQHAHDQWFQERMAKCHSNIVTAIQNAESSRIEAVCLHFSSRDEQKKVIAMLREASYTNVVAESFNQKGNNEPKEDVRFKFEVPAKLPGSDRSWFSYLFGGRPLNGQLLTAAEFQSAQEKRAIHTQAYLMDRCREKIGNAQRMGEFATQCATDLEAGSLDTITKEMKAAGFGNTKVFGSHVSWSPGPHCS